MKKIYVVWSAFDGGTECFYSDKETAERAFEWLLLACLDEGLKPYQMIGIDIREV